MTNHMGNGTGEWDAIVVGGGHNGLVCAAYMGKAALRVLVLESREVFGGPSGSFEFMPGYTASFSNSPGSLETRVVEELDLPGAGLKFLRSDPTVIQFFPEHPFVVWRDMARVCAQLDALCPGRRRPVSWVCSQAGGLRHPAQDIDIQTCARPGLYGRWPHHRRRQGHVRAGLSR